MSTARLVWGSRRDLDNLVRRFPRLVLAEVMYLIRGTEPGPPSQRDPIPSDVIPYGNKPTVNVLLDRTIPCLQLARPSPLLPELDPAMRRRGEGGGEDAGSIGSAALQDTVCEVV